jgi:hypothetical protein
MKYFGPALVLISVLMFQTSTADATPILFEGSLTGANEVPPVASPGTGHVTVALDTTAETIKIDATFSGLTSNDVAAHIHCCAPLGTNAGVATTLPAFMGFPLGVTSGTFDHTFSLTDSTFYNPAFVMSHGGTVAAAEAALETGILDEMTYFNIHTVNFTGGEIRSQLFAVPEPAGLLLLGSALFGFGIMRRRRS